MKASSQSQSSCSAHVITRVHPEAGSSSVWPLCLCQCRTSLTKWRGWIPIEGRRCQKVSTSHQNQNGMRGNRSPSCFLVDSLLDLYGLKMIFRNENIGSFGSIKQLHSNNATMCWPMTLRSFLWWQSAPRGRGGIDSFIITTTLMQALRFGGISNRCKGRTSSLYMRLLMLWMGLTSLTSHKKAQNCYFFATALAWISQRLQRAAMRCRWEKMVLHI